MSPCLPNRTAAALPIQERTDSLAMGAAPGAWFHLTMTHAVVVSLPFHLSTPSDARNGLPETMPRRRFAATRRPLSRVDLLKPRSLPARGRRTRIHSPSAGTLSKRVKTRPRFRRCFVPGTTRQHANESATALQQSSLDSHPLLLAGHSQTGLLEHRGDLFPGTGSTTPGRHSPSQLSDDLRPADHVPRGCYPSGLAPYVPGSRLGIVSAKIP